MRRVIVLAALTTCGPTASGRDDFGDGRLTRNQTLALAWHFAQWRSAGDPATELLRRSATSGRRELLPVGHCGASSFKLLHPAAAAALSESEPAGPVLSSRCRGRRAVPHDSCHTCLGRVPQVPTSSCRSGLAAHRQAGIARGRPAWQATGSARRRRLVGIGLPTCRGVTGQLSVTPSLRSNQRTWPPRRVRIQGPGRDSESD